MNIISATTYTLDNVGNRLSATDELGRTTYYTYDNLYQLTRVDYHEGQTVEYTYDPVGNRISQNGTPYLYDAANRLEQVGSVPYHYDANGNLVSVGDSVYYQYDYENRLVVYTDQNSATHYTYDGDGNRIGQSVAGSVYGTFEYVYDINRGLPHLLVEKDGAGNINQYTYAGRVLSRTGPKGQIFYHQDGLGSITLITDTYGQALNRYEYDAFGSPRSVWETVYNPFLFTGEPYDSNGLIFVRARYYDPATGRFLSKDTYLGMLNDPLSQNLYVYVGNNPVLYVDPSGHMAVCAGAYLTNDRDILRLLDKNEIDNWILRDLIDMEHLRYRLKSEKLSIIDKLKIRSQIAWLQIKTNPPLISTFAAKPDIKQVNDAAKALKMTEEMRRAFGDFIESEKLKGQDFSWKELIKLGKEFLEMWGK